MATDSSRLLTVYLNQLFRNDPTWTLEAVFSASNVPRETIRRIMKGQVKRPHIKTIASLANFIETATGGTVCADYLISADNKDFRDVDLSQVDFSGQDLSGADFRGGVLTGARFNGALIEGAMFDLADMRDVEMVGVKGKASFQCTNLCGAEIAQTTIDWVMTGAQVRNSYLHDLRVDEEARLNGVDFSGRESRWERILWQANGSRTIGARLPEHFDLHEVQGAFCDHLLIVRSLEDAFGISLSQATGDQDVLYFAEYLLARENALLACYDGAARRLLYHQPHIIDALLDAFGRYKDWYIKERLLISLHVEEYCKTLDDFLSLTGSVFYSPEFLPADGLQNSRAIIDKYIRRAKKGEFIESPAPLRTEVA